MNNLVLSIGVCVASCCSSSLVTSVSNSFCDKDKPDDCNSKKIGGIVNYILSILAIIIIIYVLVKGHLPLMTPKE